MAKDKIAMTRNDLERYGARLKAKRGVTRKQAASKLKKIMIALRVAAKKLTRSGAGGVFKRSTGRLSRSIDYRVVGLTGYLTVGVVYGQIQNTGGIIKRHRIAPKHKKALAWGGTKRKRKFFSKGHDVGPIRIKGTNYAEKAYLIQKPLIDRELDKIFDFITE